MPLVFIAASEASIEAFKTANLLKTLNVNTLISGANGTGKLTLAQYILPNATILDATETNEITSSLQSVKELIIKHIEHASNINTIIELAKEHGVRLVVTCSDKFTNESLDESFSVQLFIPPLEERQEDCAKLIEKFSIEANGIFQTASKLGTDFELDLSQNCYFTQKTSLYVNHVRQCGG